MVSRRTRVVSWIFRRDHPSRPNAMICCFFSSFKTFAMLREATYPPAAVNVLDVSSESMAAFQVFLYGRFWVFTEDGRRAVPMNFFMLLQLYQNHPEAKSLGPNGNACEPDTRGLLQRAHIIANLPLIYIGKESDKHWEEGEDLSLLEFNAIEYKRKGYTVAT